MRGCFIYLIKGTTTVSFILLLDSLLFCLQNTGYLIYWNHGCFLTHLSLNPASLLTLIEAASAALTVSLTAWLSFCALKTSMSMASCPPRCPCSPPSSSPSQLKELSTEFLGWGSSHKPKQNINFK